MQSKPEHPRSPHWPHVRAVWLHTHPTCAACGGTEALEVHHKQPFHLNPARELDPTNFITLCECPGSDHHLHFGHLGDWKSYNQDVETDAAAYLGKVKRRPIPEAA